MPAIGECIALYEYSADTENHLKLQVGDVIVIYQKEPTGWWSGVKKGTQQAGWFPATYVQLSQETPMSPHPPSSSSSNRNSTVQTSGNSLWEQNFTEDGEVFYVNAHTGESSWTIPTESSTSTPVDESWDYIPIVQTRVVNKSKDSGFDDLIIADGMSTVSLGNGFKAKRLSTAASLFSTGSTKSSSATVPPTSIPSLTLIDPNPTPLSDNNRFGYSNNFWSDKGDKSGFDILVLKHRNGKEVCKEIAAFMTERARIEEVYAKSMMELAKSSLGELESGTSKTAWNQLKFDLQTQAQSRLSFVEKINKEVQEPVMKFKNEQKKMRKNYEGTIAADRKTMLLKHAHVQRVHKIYIQRSKEAEIADALLSRGHLPSMTRKDFLKVEETARKERKKASMAAYDYKLAVEDYEKVRRTWEDDMMSATSEFQQAEEERLDFLKTVLQDYMKVQKEVNLKCKESSEMVESSIDAVSKEVDIEMFVKQHFTGNYRPPQLKFEQYSYGI